MPVRTIKAQGGQYTGPFSWENRRFTVAELKRLQTIPDAYEVVGNRQVCNAFKDLASQTLEALNKFLQ